MKHKKSFQTNRKHYLWHEGTQLLRYFLTCFFDTINWNLITSKNLSSQNVTSRIITLLIVFSARCKKFNKVNKVRLVLWIDPLLLRLPKEIRFPQKQNGYHFHFFFQTHYLYRAMTDVHNPETRSYNMSRVRSKNTKPEMTVRKFLICTDFV